MRYLYVFVSMMKVLGIFAAAADWIHDEDILTCLYFEALSSISVSQVQKISLPVAVRVLRLFTLLAASLPSLFALARACFAA